MPMQLAGETDVRLDDSRSLAISLKVELGSKLKKALEAGGPVEAVSVCQLEAPEIADRLSSETPARIGRTALKIRNPANRADPDAMAVLEAFQQSIQKGASEPPEHFATAPDGSARYMKAIITQPMCLACHGSELSTEVKSVIALHYPQDEATGFAAGELRGAFIIDWPAPLDEDIERR